MDGSEYKGKKVTVMGLGLNGGGLASVRFFASRGAVVTATDLRNEEILRPSLDKLQDLTVRYVLGEHRMEDFSEADLVIKNPAVPRDSPYLQAARQVETDLSVFLKACTNPLIAVTGSKGKSTTVSALKAILLQKYPGVQLGGNITVSPLTFLDDLKPEDPVILELSSWQLGDLKGKNLLHPAVSIITNIMNDHQNVYHSFEAYADDKMEVFRGQDSSQYALFLKDSWGDRFIKECPARSFQYARQKEAGTALWLEGESGWFETDGRKEQLLPSALRVPGGHFRLNCLLAAAAARLFGLSPEEIQKGLAEFPGVPHRMELLRERQGVRFYNDTAATIPEAMAAGVESFECPVRLIAGGNDKELEYCSAGASLQKAEAIYLLKGTATDKMIQELEIRGIAYNGPYPSLKEAFDHAVEGAHSGDAVLLSPGATSFGMFINEFDRGNQFRTLVAELP